MRILQINKFFFLKGGSEKYFFDLSELLEKKGHDVFVFSTKHPKNFKWPKQENFVSYNDFSKHEGFFSDISKAIKIFWNREANKKLKALIEKEKPDVAHLHNIFHHFSPSIISVLKKANIPIVMTLHDYKLFCPNYMFYSQGKVCYDCLKKKNFRNCLTKKCVKDSAIKSSLCMLEAYWQKHLKVADQIDAFITPSKFMRSKAIAAGIAKDKVYWLPNFLETPQDLTVHYTERQKYFLYFGRLSKEKGVAWLIKAFSRIATKYPHWKLKIAGRGSELKALKDLVKSDKQSAQQIEFVGFKKGKDLTQLIEQSYATVLPALWPEDYPYSILESFLARKPVIGTNLGGISEMVEHEQTGLLVKPNKVNELASRMEWAIEHPRKMTAMGKAAQLKAVVASNSEKHYKELIAIYEKLNS